MKPEIKKNLELIASNVGSENFIEITENCLGEMRNVDSRGESIASLLRLLEQNPNTDFGMPGPIVHFVEKFFRKGYESELVMSLERKPTCHTLWMLNRLINGTDGDERSIYVALMKNIASNIDVHEEVRKDAINFSKYYS